MVVAQNGGVSAMAFRRGRGRRRSFRRGRRSFSRGRRRGRAGRLRVGFRM